MPEVKTLGDVQEALSGLNKTVEALKAQTAEERAANIQAREQVEKSLATFSANVATQRMQGRHESPDSDLDFCMLDRDGAHDLLGSANRGFDYAVPAAGESSGDVVVLRSVETDEGLIPGLLDSEELRTPWSSRLRELLTMRNVVRFVAAQGGNSGRGWARHVLAGNRAVRRHLGKAPTPELRAIFTKDRIERLFNNSSSEGAELIFDFDMPTLAEKVDMEATISGLFAQMPVGQGNRVVVPTTTGGITPFARRPQTVDDGPKLRKSSAVFSSKTYDLTGFTIATQYDEDAANDVSWISIAQLLMAQMVRAHAWGRENALLHGDTAATHQDAIHSWNPRNMFTLALLGGTDDHRTVWRGLRAFANDVSASASHSGDANMAISLRAARGELQAPLGLMDVVHLVSYETFLDKLVGLDDFKTLDAYGQRATQISGNIVGPLPNQVGVIDGVPICIAWFLTADLETSGLYTDGSGGKSGFITVPRSKWKLMVRQGARVESAKDITRQVYDTVLTARELFALDPGIPDTQKAAYYGYNI